MSDSNVASGVATMSVTRKLTDISSETYNKPGYFFFFNNWYNSSFCFGSWWP